MDRRVTRSNARIAANNAENSREALSNLDIYTKDHFEQAQQHSINRKKRCNDRNVADSVTKRHFIVIAEAPLTQKSAKMRRGRFKLLLRKSRLLKDLNLPDTFHEQEYFSNISTVRREGNESVDHGILADCAASILIFASEHAGTAVCIDPSGVLLTCAHCIAEDSDEYAKISKMRRSFWLLTAVGHVVEAKCMAWDAQRDLALLKIENVFEAQQEQSQPLRQREVVIHCLNIARRIPKKGIRVFCIGHPGSEDLEAEEQGTKTGYPVLAISQGRFRGYAPGQDVQDNSDMGALMHDAWTYWGHSGAPLVDFKSGELVGLHSSWDDETSMRRGAGIEAIQAFLDSTMNTSRSI